MFHGIQSDSLRFVSFSGLLLVLFLVDFNLKVEALPQQRGLGKFDLKNLHQELGNNGNNATIENIQLERHNLIVKNCRKKKSYLTAARFYADDKHQLLYCYIPKVASTNLKLLMLILSGDIKPKNYTLLPQYMIHFDNPMESIKVDDWKELAGKGLSKYSKFIFTRHPFERLVSAYYDKFTDKSKKKAISITPVSKSVNVPAKNSHLPSKEHRVDNTANKTEKKKVENTKYVSHMLKIGTKIVKKYRAKPSKSSLEKGNDVTILEFVSYVIEEWKDRMQKPVDVHWRPMVDLCHPCSIRYDTIGKFETMQQDIDHLLHQLKEAKIGNFFEAYQPYATSSLVKEFMEQISEEQWNALVRMYKEDFKIFGYHPDIYRPTSFSPK